MNFFGRQEELSILEQEKDLSKSSARFTIVMGRRRIGKTHLIRYSMKNDPYLYVLAKNEAEPTYCAMLQQQIQRELNIPIYGKVGTMRELFEILFSYATHHHLNLIIDEIQEFFNVRKSIFADMQEMWDKYKPDMKINFIACGSIYSLMKEIFDNRREAMYGRLTRRLEMKAFPISTIKQILGFYYAEYTPEDLLCLYMLTGGVAKYIEILIDRHAYTKSQMLRCFVEPYSPFLTEGTDLIHMEFRRDSAVYNSILSLIAEGKNTTGQIDSILNTTSSAYLRNLEINYSLLKKNRPIFASERTRGVKYQLDDNFMLFWFRFIYPNLGLVENQRTDLLLEIIEEGYNVYSGLILERYFRQRLREEERFSLVGNWWDNKGENEIDIVAINRLEKKARIAEVKVNPRKISLGVLEQKAQKILGELKRYSIEYKGYSLADM